MQFHKLNGLLLVCFLLSPMSWAAPAADYWSYWDVSDDASVELVDHSAWDHILSTYVAVDAETGIASFAYGSVTPDDKDAIESYIKSLAKLKPRQLARTEQQAYWMNLYNALSVSAVLENLQSLEEQGYQQSLTAEAWEKKRIKVSRKNLSLNDIEHRILRPIFRDHRILFGLNCATLDCPNFSERAYTAATVKAQLKEAGARFINNNTGVLYQNGVLQASRLFKDYLGDFAQDEHSLTKVLAHYAEDMKALYVLGYTGAIVYTQDSRLNIR